MPERLVWDRKSLQPSGALSVGFDLDPADLTPGQLEALRALRAAFFLFDKETPTRCRE